MIELLRAIKGNTGTLPEYAKSAVSNIVPKVAENYSQITGINRSPKFFYREAGDTVDFRKTKFQTFGEFYFSVATANRQSGRLIEAGFESMVAVVDSFLMQKRVRDFWEIEESMSNRMVELRKAKIAGDLVGMVIIQSKLEADIKELGRSLAVGVAVRN